MESLNDKERELLRSVLQRSSERIEEIGSRAEIGDITPEEREALSTIVLDMFLGELDENSEPTKIGVQLDDLISALQRVCPLQERPVDEIEVERILNGPTKGGYR